MSKIVKFKVEHIDLMCLREHEQSIVGQPARMKALEEASIAVTGVADGRIVLCGGVMPYLAGTADVWLLPSIYLPNHAKTVIPKLKEWLYNVREDLALTRLETSCLDDALHTRWMKWLGFEQEGIRRKFYMGKDYVMWSKICQ